MWPEWQITLVEIIEEDNHAWKVNAFLPSSASERVRYHHFTSKATFMAFWLRNMEGFRKRFRIVDSTLGA
jgi:hypothetical protein